MTPKPIVDLSPKPSRWRRFVARCWSLLATPPAYQPRACEPCGPRALNVALAGFILAVIFAVYALRGLWL